jgi:hypothetical protein
MMAYDMDIPVNDIMDMLLEKKSDELKKKLDNGNVLFFKGKNYRDLTKPLNELLKKDERLVWNKKRQEMFEEPLQQNKSGDWQLCTYWLKSFNKTKQNNDIGERELLMIIRILGSPDWIT